MEVVVAPLIVIIENNELPLAVAAAVAALVFVAVVTVTATVVVYSRDVNVDFHSASICPCLRSLTYSGSQYALPLILNGVGSLKTTTAILTTAVSYIQ